MKRDKAPRKIILLYHSLGTPPPDDAMQLRVPLSEFKKQMQALALAGWKFRTAAELNQPMTNGREVAVSFDDGYQDQMEAAEILESFGARGTFFVIPGLLGKKMPGEGCWTRWDLMSSDQVKELPRRGHEIGGHSLTHPGPLNLEKPDTQRQEIFACRKRLEDMIGGPIQGFSYPHGGYSTAVQELVADAGYRYASCSRPGSIQRGVNSFELPRIEIRGRDTLGIFLSKVSGQGELWRLLRYRISRWIQTP